VLLSRESLLRVYEREVEIEIEPGERLFRIVALASFLLFGGIGTYLSTHNPPERLLEERAVQTRQVTFLIEENKKPEMTIVEPKPAPVGIKEQVSEKPIDLTNKPLLDQKIEDTKPDNSTAITGEPVRRVYGIRRVYSTGIGAGGSASDAVVGKLGNSLATDIDTLKATEKDLRGTLVPVTTLQIQPKAKVQIKPEYTNEMIAHQVQGIIKARLLIDIDGAVKEVEVLNDLGFGTKDLARATFLKWKFEPGKVDGVPKATWITFSIRFVLLDE
jgi:hypothetical protein